jgi:hypothetical protein
MNHQNELEQMANWAMFATLINKAVDDLSAIEKDHLFTVLEEKLDYPANLEESIHKKAVKTATSEIGTLRRRFKAHLRKNM